ncbi:MAG: choice-of-anchor D domain-containing protein [Alphaproteobacteria bacterium]|nr:choice-of-anchor D domain-containing protein [Alphaproteobacteria bacterium]
MLLFLIGMCFCASLVDPVPVEVEPPDETTTCVGELEADVSSLDFDDTPLGETTELEIELRNDSDCPIEIASVAWRTNPGPFEASMPRVTELGWGDSAWFAVRFRPEDIDPHQRTLWIETADGQRVDVGVWGQGFAGDPEVLPQVLYFEPAPVGCETSETIHVRNRGTGPLTISSITPPAGGHFRVEGELPVTLEVGQRQDFDLVFASNEVGSWREELHFTFGDSLWDDMDIPLYGEAVDGGFLEVSRTWDTQPRGDLLVVVSTAEGMAPYLEDLEDAIDPMLDALQETSVDWQIGVVTQDSGCVLGANGIADADQERGLQEAALRTMLWSPSESGSAYARSPLALAAAALSPDNLAEDGCNAALRREGATLGIIGVIRGPDASPDPAGAYVAAFRALVDAPEDLTIHGVATPAQGCDASAHSALLAEAVAETGGAFTSICEDDLGEGLDWIVRRAVADPLRLYLPETPYLGSLQVTVNGVVQTAGWRWDSALNAVVFSSQRSDGDEVVVRYQLPGACGATEG